MCMCYIFIHVFLNVQNILMMQSVYDFFWALNLRMNVIFFLNNNVFLFVFFFT